jgi:glycosyltransferase involved in cell wall biosynthesis
VGSLSAWHGISLIPEIAKRLLEVRDDFAFFVVGGDQNHLRKYRELVAAEKLGSHLIFTGSVPYQEVSAHINAMDVALVPDTNYWTCPTKMFEYQASGIPTIAPEYPAVLRAMDHGREGLLFKPRDVDEVARLILSLADHPEERKRMGDQARARVASTHSWRHNVERILSLFTDIKEGKISLDGSLGK